MAELPLEIKENRAKMEWKLTIRWGCGIRMETKEEEKARGEMWTAGKEGDSHGNKDTR